MASGGYGEASGRWDSQTLSLRLFVVSGIRVRIHAFAIAMMFFWAVDGYRKDHFYDALMLIGMLFLSVLLHEFGHCFGCRSVGGRADDILMWPLGGLAFCDPPHRPREHLITVLCGPAVNLAICVILFPILLMQGADAAAVLNPFASPYIFGDSVWHPLALAFRVNYWNFLFNMLLPLYPFDGGRIVQVALWYRLDYFRSMLISCMVGLIAAPLLGAVALYNQNLLLAGVMVFGFIQCWQMKTELEMRGPSFDNDLGYDFSQGYTSLERNQPSLRRAGRAPNLRQRFAAWRRKRRTEAGVKLEAEVDQILAKIHEQGMNALTAKEKRLLTLASKKKRSV